MKLIKTQDIASVTFFTAELAEDELEALEACLAHVLERCSDEEIERLTGFEREVMEDIHAGLRDWIETHVPDEYLSERYRAPEQAQGEAQPARSR